MTKGGKVDLSFQKESRMLGKQSCVKNTVLSAVEIGGKTMQMVRRDSVSFILRVFVYERDSVLFELVES